MRYYIIVEGICKQEKMSKNGVLYVSFG